MASEAPRQTRESMEHGCVAGRCSWARTQFLWERESRSLTLSCRDRGPDGRASAETVFTAPRRARVAPRVWVLLNRWVSFCVTLGFHH